MTRAPGPLPPGLTRDELLAEVARVLSVVAEGEAGVVALSGGPDSTALAYLVGEARPDLAVTLGHVRHGLRDDRQDVETVTAHAAALGVPLVVRRVDVEPAGQGLEAAARRARHDALTRIAEESGARWVLLGHTADDQAETVLMRIARGTGISGLAGMAPVSRGLVRPMLGIRRGDVRAFVEGEGLDAVEDPMNRDRAFQRVRTRHDVLPVLEAISSDAVGALCRLADLAREDARTLDAEAADATDEVLRRYGPGAAIPDALVEGASPAVARRMVRELLAEVRVGDLPVDAAHIDAVLGLPGGAALDVPGARISRGGGWLAAVPHGVRVDHEPVPLAVPGTTPWTPAGVVLRAVVDRAEAQQLAIELPDRGAPAAAAEEAVPPGGDPALHEIVLGPGRSEGLAVRRRRPGDRLHTAAGTRKLQDLLVDAGVPRVMRDLVPLVVHAGRIIWVPGIAMDADAAEEGRASPTVRITVVPRR